MHSLIVAQPKTYPAKTGEENEAADTMAKETVKSEECRWHYQQSRRSNQSGNPRNLP